MPILHLPGEMIPGQFGPIRRESPVLQKFPGLHHVERRNALGDADDQIDFRVGRFHDGVGRERRRHENHRGVGAGLVGRFLHGVEDRPALVRGAALARRDAADNLRAVSGAGFRMKRAFAAGQALHDDSRIFIDQDCHK